MAIEPRRDKHHFLARHLLAHFAAADELLYVYDRRKGWAKRRDMPERLAVQNFLYAPGSATDAAQDPKDDAVERWLAKEIDGPAAAPIAELTAGASIDDLAPAGIHAIANFIALLDLRTPAIRDLLVPAFRGAATQDISDTKRTQRELRKKGVHVTRGEVRRVARDKGPRIAADLAKPAWLNYLQETRNIARINLKARRWCIVTAGVDTEFITSDLGMAKSLLGPLEPVSWEPGTLLGRAHWIIPLSPQRALTVTPKDAPDPQSSPELVLRTNEQLIKDARRYVYSRTLVDTALFAGAPEPEGTSGSLPPQSNGR